MVLSSDSLPFLIVKFVSEIKSGSACARDMSAAYFLNEVNLASSWPIDIYGERYLWIGVKLKFNVKMAPEMSGFFNWLPLHQGFYQTVLTLGPARVYDTRYIRSENGFKLTWKLLMHKARDISNLCLTNFSW